MGILDNIFGAPAAQPQVQVVPPSTSIPPTAGQTAPATPGTAPNGTIPEGTDTSTTAPLEAYKDLWKDEPVDPNAAPVDKSIFGQVNGEALLEAAGKIDFTKVITPDLAAAAAAGGEEGFKALMTAMNKVAALTHAQSSAAAAKIAEMAVEKATSRFNESLPTKMRDTTSLNLVKQNPVLSHPGVSPMINGLMTQLQAKFPEATPEQLRTQAEDYLQHFTTSYAASIMPADSNPANTKDTMDWEAFLDLSPSPRR